MPGSIFFVHGAGDRGIDPTPLEHLGDVADRLGSGVKVVPAPWGEQRPDHVPLQDVVPTLPALAAGAPAVVERDVGLVELALGRWDPVELVRDRLAGLRDDMLRDARPSALEISSAERLDELADDPLLAAAARSMGPADPQLWLAVAREVDRDLERQEASDEVRTNLVCRVLRWAWPPRAEREAGWVSPGMPSTPSALPAQISRLLTAQLRACRFDIMAQGANALADFVFYLSHREPMQGVVEGMLREAPQPVVAVGHSLGGLILTDLLGRARPEGVAYLVTVGAQPGLLRLAGALDVPPDEEPFTPWLNVYSSYDFASFLAAPAFPGVAGIEDYEVETDVGFPDSHLAYWRQERFKQKLEAVARSARLA